MAVKFSNNAKTTLSSGITSSATSIAVVDASAWPTLGSGDHTLCTFIDGADADVLEIVKVTAISGNTLTVVRAQEGTTARAFSSGEKAELRITAGLLEAALTGTDVVKLDSLTASATASYSMAVSGVAYSPSNVNALIVSLNGVTQEPTEAFTISGSTLTFASALTSADSIDYIVDLAKTLDIGEPSDNTVSPAKLTSAVNLDAITDNGATTTNAVTVGNLTSTGIDDNATSTAITIDGGENIGVGETSPAARIHSKTTTQTLALLETTNSTRGILFLKDANTTGNTHVGIGAVGNDLQLFSGGSTARVTINNTGNVGIGVTPLGNLSVEGQGRVITIGDSATTNVPEIKSTNAAGTGEAFLKLSAYEHRLFTGGQQRVTLNNNGRLGIGEISPLALLHVKATEGSTGETDPIARFERFTTGDNAYLDITVNNSTNMIGFQSTGTSNGGFTFGGATADLVTITSAGNVGVGTDPAGKFQVRVGTNLNIAMNQLTSENVARISAYDDAVSASVPLALEGEYLKLRTGAQDRLIVDSAGNVGVGSGTGGIVNSAGYKTITLGGNDGSQMIFRKNNVSEGFLYTTTSTCELGALGDLHLHSGSTGSASGRRLTITSAGNVGIGTTPPAQRQLYVQEAGTGYGGAITSATATAGGNAGYRYDTAGVTRWSTTLVGTAGNEDLRFMKDGSSEKYRFGATGKMTLMGLSGGLQLRTGTVSRDAFIDWQFNSTTTNFIRMGIDYDTRGSTGWMVDSGYPITLDYTTSLVLKSSGTEKARLDVNGHLLVGRSSTGASATDYGSNIYANGQIYSYTSSSGGSDMYRLYNSAGTLAYSIKANGTVYSVSDRVLKENIVDSESALAIVNDIKVRSFDWREDGDHVSHGFIAQELNEAYPEAASEPLEDQVHWSVDYTRLVPVLTKAIQDQQAIIEDLQTRLSALEAN